MVLDRSPDRRARFLQRHALHPLSPGEEVQVLELLEMQRHAMLMYTSCGWFFDELSGIETVQVIQYAGRALQLAEKLFGERLEPAFLEQLERAKSNVAEYANGRRIYERAVKPSIVDLSNVGAHYAVSSLFDSYQQQDRVYCYRVEAEEYRQLSAGKAKLALGRARVTSEVTQEDLTVSFGALHLGDHNVAGGIRKWIEGAESGGDEALADAFSRADIPAVLRLLDRSFDGGTYSLKVLFRDEQRRILDLILNSTIEDAETVYRQLYEEYAPLMRFLADLKMPLPSGLQVAAELALNNALRRALGTRELDHAHISALLAEAERAGAALDRASFGYTLSRTIDALVDRFREEPYDLDRLKQLSEAVALAQRLPFDIHYWKAQNEYYGLLRHILPGVRARAASDDEDARAWVERFVELGERLRVRVAGS